QEQQAMLRYLAGGTCLMESLRSALDDPAAQPCGRCSVCTGQLPPPGAEPDPDVLAAALGQLRSVDAVLEPRRMWPAGPAAGERGNPAAPARRGTPSEPGRGGTPPMPARRGKIPEPSRAEPGRALAFAQDPGWGDAVQRALAVDGPVDQEIFDGCVRLLARWGWPAGRPVSVVPMPSRRRGLLVADLAERLAAVGRLEVAPVLGQVDDETFQDDAQTGRGSAEGALRRLSVIAPVPAGPVLLVDDVSRSGFTLTVAAALLREAGAGPVYPLVLHKRP
ncbi:MAG TPA: phosphoribosyltransferase, partial [Mycobacteriales bacterium]|nr:phosphoribosyltransferase [Mycobacteriales bacterium]